jgi:3-oxoacyl-[acyl-carrier protein] reductase
LKLAVISGASKGLGKELAPLIAASGYKVITLGLSSPSDVDFRTDLTSLDQTQKLIEEIREKYGNISLLIANAGGGKKPSEDSDNDDFHSYFMARNFLTARNLIESSLDSLRETEGNIVAISSIVAIKEVKSAPVGYSKSKAVLNRYVIEVAKQNAQHNVRANLISPGNLFFAGSRWEELLISSPDLVASILSEEVPLGRFITPQEVAAAINYLSSDEACNITGANIVIDGGQSL